VRKIAVSLTVFVLGLFVANYFFGVDVPKLFNGFVDLTVNLFTGSRE
jgi:hypothetical protein